MRVLVLVVAVLLAGCGSGAEEMQPQPDIDTLYRVTASGIQCDGAEVQFYPPDAPTAWACTWSCVSHWGSDLLQVKVLFRRPSAQDPWPTTFYGYYATLGVCPR